MKFRQRMAWLMLFAYLLATLAVVYYLFELSGYFGALTNAIVQQRRASAGMVLPSSNSLKLHMPVSDESRERLVNPCRLASIPKPFIFCIFCILYIQTFCVLYACTRPTFHCHPFLIMLPILGCVFLFRGTSHNNPQAKGMTENMMSDERWTNDVLSNAVLQYKLPLPVVTGLNHIQLEGS